MPIQTINIGNHVVCDACCRDFTNSEESGGFLFGRTGGKAIGPCCAARWEASAKNFGEEEFITQRCPAGISFRDFVLRVRNGDNTINILTGDEARQAIFGTDEENP